MLAWTRARLELFRLIAVIYYKMLLCLFLLADSPINSGRFMVIPETFIEGSSFGFFESGSLFGLFTSKFCRIDDFLTRSFQLDYKNGVSGGRSAD